ncbi:uncharacterized protein LOC116846338 [Odontomachus brunneus]|uniref:uncharacterized protein LOC116846338 n=1 Tax=Odontomachus brunneus TaxID=486640 RepID=UPI0013F18F53|nr:uncharacterized protein LOC116846338 [Odontomachus brunneus]
MDSGKFEEDLGGFIGRRAQVSSDSDTMDFESVDLGSEIDTMLRNINYYKSKLQSCREKYENVETEISNVRRSQHKTQRKLHHARMEEQNLRELFEKIHLDHEACVKKSDGYKDLDERIHATISELTTQRSALMQELAQLKKNTEDNCRKLSRVNAMITEQEEKNEVLLRKLMKESENSLIPQNMQWRINAFLEHLKRDEGHIATANDTME